MSPDTMFRGTANRRTFVRAIDEDRFVIYSVSLQGVRQERFCSRSEWDAWCEQHAPPVAKPGMTVNAPNKAVVVVRELEAGTLECHVTEKRIFTQDQADRLVRKLLAESRRDGPAPDAPDDDGA